MSKTLLLTALLVLTSCATIKSEVAEFAMTDLQLTSDMAGRHGREDVKQCADFLITSLGGLNTDQAKLDALLAEETRGVFSAALKAALVRDYLASLNDPARAQAFKTAFDTNCKAVAGQILLNLVRDAAKFGAKR